MEIHGPATEDEMIAAFLKAEIDSYLYSGTCIRSELANRHLLEDVIRVPDLDSNEDNNHRSAILLACRGWRSKSEPYFLFREWPYTLTWEFVTFTRADLSHMYFGNETEWSKLTQQSLLVTDAAEHIVIGDYDSSSSLVEAINVIKGIAQNMREDVEPVIAMGTQDHSVIVMVDGWKRMTAFAMVETKQELRGFFASGPLSEVQSWHFYPPQRL